MGGVCLARHPSNPPVATCPSTQIKEDQERLRVSASTAGEPAVTPEEAAADAAAAAVATAAEAAAANAAAAAAAAADASGSALAPQGDPMGCIAVKDAEEGIDDDWCRNTCSQSASCPTSMCECNDDNGVLRYDPNDPDIPVSATPPPPYPVPACCVASPAHPSNRPSARVPHCHLHRRR